MILLRRIISSSSYLLLFALMLSSCREKYRLQLLVAEEDKPVMEKIANDINIHSDFDISVVAKDSLTEVGAIQRLLVGDCDLITVDNTLDYHGSKKEIRTIIPFFHEVLVVASRHELQHSDIDSLMRSGRYMVLSKEVDELDFFKKLIPNFTGDSIINYRLENHYDLETDFANYDLLLFFSALENYELGRLLFDKKANIYSLDDDEMIGEGSFIEGFCQSYKKTTPYMLSRFAFGVGLDKPTYTLAVHELLITTTDLANKVVYDLIGTIHQHHIVPIFESSNSYTFEVNHQDINLSFPFHYGTIDYVNRDKPTFVERYSEFMGFILSVFIVLAGLTASLRARVNQRKKDRMDIYYHELLEIKERVKEVPSSELRSKLNEMQKVVFDLLIKEKLSANNEFVIFMMLWDELHHELVTRDEPG